MSSTDRNITDKEYKDAITRLFAPRLKELKILNAFDSVGVYRCENGVGEWEVRSDCYGHEVFDNRDEADARRTQIIKDAIAN